MDCVPQNGSGCVLVAGLGHESQTWWTGNEMIGSIRPEVASGQREAIRVVHRKHVDVAVVNRELADGDGFVLVSLLKELLPGLMVILTGRGREPDEEIEAYASGASLYLPLPVDAREMAQVITSCLSRAGRVPSGSLV